MELIKTYAVDTLLNCTAKNMDECKKDKQNLIA